MTGRKKSFLLGMFMEVIGVGFDALIFIRMIILMLKKLICL